MLNKPFGTWTSQITSKAITAGSVSFGGIYLSPSLVGEGSDSAPSVLYWLEGRPQEGGRNVLCRLDSPSPAVNPNDLFGAERERHVKDVTPKTSNARSRVHEYGGGAVTFGNKNGQCYFSEFATQQLCSFDLDGADDTAQKAVPLTSTTDSSSPQYRFADGVIDSEDEFMYCIREDHTNPSPKDVVNEIVQVDLRDGSVTVVATGNDFYASPRLSPDGTLLAYVTWDHPNMPWDATELRVTTLQSNRTATNEHLLIAGSDGDSSILQPLWHPQPDKATENGPSRSEDLYYISDESGYYNIYKASSGADRAFSKRKQCVLPMDVDFGGAAPGWKLGQQGFSFLPDGRLIAQYQHDGKSILLVADTTGPLPLTNKQTFSEEDGLPMQFGSVIGDAEQNLFLIGGSPSIPKSIYKWNLKTKGPAEILVCSSSLSYPDDLISVPKQIEFPTTVRSAEKGTTAATAFAYYYPPKNGVYSCTTEKAPPLLVKAHGGPTACTGTSFHAGIQFWTSRGFAVLDVDYGGSTGYGRDYRRRLRKSWGVVDIDDVCAGAKYLVEQGLADENRLCIDGGSAGGYTALGALAFKDVFTAGCSLYGIGDLTALAGDTHKFESRYLDGLVGAYPAEEALYKERSPIESVDTLSCPILILQGAEDKIVPPNQARMMHEALQKKGIPTCLKIYEGEQHGFRKAENIEDALDSELAFYGKVYGIDIPDAIEITIDNMKN